MPLSMAFLDLGTGADRTGARSVDPFCAETLEWFTQVAYSDGRTHGEGWEAETPGPIIRRTETQSRW